MAHVRRHAAVVARLDAAGCRGRDARARRHAVAALSGGGVPVPRRRRGERVRVRVLGVVASRCGSRRGGSRDGLARYGRRRSRGRPRRHEGDRASGWGWHPRRDMAERSAAATDGARRPLPGHGAPLRRDRGVGAGGRAGRGARRGARVDDGRRRLAARPGGLARTGAVGARRRGRPDPRTRRGSSRRGARGGQAACCRHARRARLPCRRSRSHTRRVRAVRGRAVRGGGVARAASGRTTSGPGRDRAGPRRAVRALRGGAGVDGALSAGVRRRSCGRAGGPQAGPAGDARPRGGGDRLCLAGGRDRSRPCDRRARRRRVVRLRRTRPGVGGGRPASLGASRRRSGGRRDGRSSVGATRHGRGVRHPAGAGAAVRCRGGPARVRRDAGRTVRRGVPVARTGARAALAARRGGAFRLLRPGSCLHRLAPGRRRAVGRGRARCIRGVRGRGRGVVGAVATAASAEEGAMGRSGGGVRAADLRRRPACLGGRRHRRDGRRAGRRHPRPRRRRHHAGRHRAVAVGAARCAGTPGSEAHRLRRADARARGPRGRSARPRRGGQRRVGRRAADLGAGAVRTPGAHRGATDAATRRPHADAAGGGDLAGGVDRGACALAAARRRKPVGQRHERRAAPATRSGGRSADRRCRVPRTGRRAGRGCRARAGRPESRPPWQRERLRRTHACRMESAAGIDKRRRRQRLRTSGALDAEEPHVRRRARAPDRPRGRSGRGSLRGRDVLGVAWRVALGL